jgi:hypothetical protein
MRLVIDYDALRVAESDLGLTLPARVTWEKLRARQPNATVLGRYNGIDVFHPMHRIALNPNARAARCNATLWHELTHALQAERLGGYARFDSEYSRQLKALGIHPGHADYYERYTSIPLEQEANAATDLALAGACATLVHVAPTVELHSVRDRGRVEV